MAHHKIIINIGHSQNRSIEVLSFGPPFIVMLSKFSHGYGRKALCFWKCFGEHIGNMLGTLLAPIGNMVETPKYRKMEPPPSLKKHRPKEKRSALMGGCVHVESSHWPGHMKIIFLKLFVTIFSLG